jgi:hypothetical protein
VRKAWIPEGRRRARRQCSRGSGRFSGPARWSPPAGCSSSGWWCRAAPRRPARCRSPLCQAEGAARRGAGHGWTGKSGGKGCMKPRRQGGAAARVVHDTEVLGTVALQRGRAQVRRGTGFSLGPLFDLREFSGRPGLARRTLGLPAPGTAVQFGQARRHGPSGRGPPGTTGARYRGGSRHLRIHPPASAPASKPAGGGCLRPCRPGGYGFRATPP